MCSFSGLLKYKKRPSVDIYSTPEAETSSPIIDKKRARPAKDFYCNLEDSGLEETPCKEKAVHWSEPVIEVMIYAGLKPGRIMRILNTFVLARLILFV